tara:strand:- start:17492 stop:18439 length:948 start_codon:yes stop_codon:yes gene_type:complete
MKPFSLVILLTLLIPSAYSQDTGSGLDFLNIGPSARSLSISQATTATQTGPSSIYSNPALLAFEPSSSAEVNYTLWISNVNNQFAAFNFRKNHTAYAFAVYNSGSDGFEARDTPGSSAGNFSVGYLSIAGAIARQAGPLSFGVTAQYLREEVFQFRANGFAFTGGVTAHLFEERVTAGLSINNLGDMESLDEQSTTLPSSINAGVNIDLIEFTSTGFNDLPILITFIADWKKPLEAEAVSITFDGDSMKDYISVAIDINAGDLLYLQTGYRMGPTERPLSFGLGLSMDPVRVNYALVPFSTGFGTVHSFGVQYNF